MIKIHFIFFISTLALLGGLHAAPAYAQLGENIEGEVSLNGSITTGNTDTTNGGFGLKLSTASNGWRHAFKSSANYGRANGKTNKSRYSLGYQLDRDIGEKYYFFGNADYFSHDFGAFKQGHFVGAGFGFRALNKQPTKLRLESGLGYRSQKSRLKDNDPSGLGSRTEEEVAARLFSDFDHKFNDNVSFQNDTELLYSSSDTFLKNEVALKSKIWSNLSIRASFRIETHTDVPEGREKTDTISRIGVVYTMN